ncbi:hypothetical protein KXV50_007586 [Aspergillus fumigatus]|nr:hypothetical protein KXX37_004416 [Aspergillus fumigatus]KAH1574075.1 hypothetical protein KXX17_008868 [Aspergillus fumigatus]KAH2286938.1 hypothetical protein KXV50_007586 [Aspergillus fumigatus]OXN03314.1 hypothetical protein CDV58_08443 [Aspergillus fumigatus]
MGVGLEEHAITSGVVDPVRSRFTTALTMRNCSFPKPKESLERRGHSLNQSERSAEI